jgi:hypothetical protein
MNEFNHEAFNTQYSATPLHFHEATSPHFKCKYAYRDEDTVLHLTPRIRPIREDMMSILKTALNSLVGEERGSTCVLEHIIDDLLEDGESIYIQVPGFTLKTLSSSELLVNRFLTAAHDRLSCGDSP